MNVQRPDAAILAGGASRRMGFDKALIRLNGVSLLRSHIRTLRRKASSVYVVSNRKLPPELTTGASVISDHYKNVGPLAGIHAAFSAGTAQTLWVTACDMPTNALPLLEFFASSSYSEEIFAIVGEDETGEIAPFNALYFRSILPVITTSIHQRKLSIRALLKEIPIKKVPFQTVLDICGRNPFISFNTPEDIENYK